MKRILMAIAALMLFNLNAAHAELALRQPCSDGMVLQQNTTAKVWGLASPGSKVVVRTSWNGASYSCTTASDGVWKVGVRTPSASYRHHSIKVSGDGGNITINDVLVGEVWLASGQSNMQMPMMGFYNCPVEDAYKFISGPDLSDKVRMYNEPLAQSYTEVRDGCGVWAKGNQNGIPYMSATAFFFARKLNEALDIPVGIINNAYGGARIESWIPESMVAGYGTEDLSRETIEATIHYTRPYLMYNAMLVPLMGYTIKGFIWYQGCSQLGHHDQFVDRMTDLVNLWRESFGDTSASLPFYMVEIAPYRYKPVTDVSYAALVRQAQHEAAHSIPNSGIVVTDDLVSPFEQDNIHPCRKQPVGERLAYLALNRDYGFDKVACASPEAVEIFKRDGFESEICVRLSNCPNGTNRWREIEGLEVCGSEGVWTPVNFAYFENDGYLRIRTEGVFDPCQVRYCWGDFKPGNLANLEGLPVAPFWLKIE